VRHLLIMNPGSKGGKSEEQFDRIHGSMKKHGLKYDFRRTENLNDAYDLCVEGHEAGYDAIIAVGGDGTINRVLNGFFTNSGKLRSNAVMGVIYSGTSPDFCKSYGIPTETERAVQLISVGKTKKIKAGMITHAETYDQELEGKFIDEIPQYGVSFFGCCANIGLGAAIAGGANTGIRKITGDKLGTFISTVKAIKNHRASNLKTVIDDKEINFEKLANLSIGRTKFIASGLKVPHELNHDDEKMYIMAARNMNFYKWLTSLIKVYKGTPFENDGSLSLSYCSKISVEGNSSFPRIEFDGDPAGFLPCKIELAKEPLTLFAEE
jgi:diacylglycerol kinase (ATP)